MTGKCYASSVASVGVFCTGEIAPEPRDRSGVRAPGAAKGSKRWLRLACCAGGDSGKLDSGFGAPEQGGCLNGRTGLSAASPTGSDGLLDEREVRQ